MNIRHVLPPTLLLALSALFSRVLGVVRDHLLARTFGATEGVGIFHLDTYYAAFRIPDLLYNLLIFGAISAAFIPIFTQYKKDHRMQDAWAFASSMLHLMFLAVLALSVVIFIFAPQLVHLVAGGFDPLSTQITVKLMRILLLSPILMSITAVLISIQDSFKSFFYRSLGPLLYNIGIIIGIIYFSEKLGVIGVTFGVIIGVALQLLIQLPALRQVKYQHQWLLGLNRQDVRQAFKLLIPRILGLSLNQLTLIISTLIASFLATGSITIFYFADNLQAVPLGMIAISFAITSFATLSELAAEKSKEPFAKEISRVMHQILFLVIPATVGMLMLRTEIISVILQAGKFTASDAALTSTVLSFLIISLFAQSLIPLLSRGFYAYHNTKTPVYTGFAGAIIAIGGSLILAFPLGLGIAGIAIAVTLGNIINFTLLYGAMRRHIGHKLLQLPKLIKYTLLSIFMGLIIHVAQTFIPFQGSLTTRLITLLAFVAIGLATYFIGAKMLKLEELKRLKRA